MNYKYFNEKSQKQIKLAKFRRLCNKIFNKFNLPIEVVNGVNWHVDMITNEQRINLYHLLLRTIHENVEGDIVEFGSHVGHSAIQIQQMVQESGSGKILHLYDKYNEIKNKNILIDKFNSKNILLPKIHVGDFLELIPQELPDKISFAHIDCGWDNNSKEHADIISYLLSHIYPRMSHHSICLLMDYHTPDVTIKGLNNNPGVKIACDNFLKDKIEKVYTLYGNNYSHGFFVKGVSG